MLATKTAVHDVIEQLCAAPSNSEAGTKFEKLMVDYFWTDPTLSWSTTRCSAGRTGCVVNDPNDWGREHHDPRYLIDLVKRATRVSVETMKTVDSLPELPLGE